MCRPFHTRFTKQRTYSMNRPIWPNKHRVLESAWF
jgi:hypothetical protein